MAILNNIRTVTVPSIGKLPLADNPGTFTPSGFKRDQKGGRLPEDGGYMETSQPARLELSLNLTPGLSVTALNNISGEDVTVRLANGEVHLLSQAYCESPAAVEDGTTKLVLIANVSESI